MTPPERLELCVSEAQLRVGMMVQINSCSHCGCNHRHIIMGRSRDTGICFNCKEPVRGHLSIAQCSHAHMSPFICPNWLIPERRLFIVDVGDTREVSYERERERAK